MCSSQGIITREREIERKIQSQNHKSSSGSSTILGIASYHYLALRPRQHGPSIAVLVSFAKILQFSQGRGELVTSDIVFVQLIPIGGIR